MIFPRRLLYGFIVLTLGNILAISGVFVYVGYAIHENNKRACGLYELIYQPTPESPVPDPNSRAGQVRSELAKLIEFYDC